MARGRATLQHLQVLQASRPLEAPPGCPGSTDFDTPESLAEGLQSGDGPHLREAVRTAEFWISLLEGEQSDLAEEVAKHKQRHQLALRQGEAKESALREAEGERKRLRAEIEKISKQRDEAICERHLLKEDTARLTSRSKDDVGALAAKVEMLEAELKRERAERASFEQQLVALKVRHAETLQTKDSMSCLIQYYEDQLRKLDPHFEPTDPSSPWLRPAAFFDPAEHDSADDGAEQPPAAEAGEKQNRAKRIAGGWGRKLKAGISKLKKKSHHDSEQPPCDSPSAGGSSPRGRGKSDAGAATPKEEGAEGREASPEVQSPASPNRGSSDEQTAAAAAAEARPSASPSRPRPRWEMRNE